MKSLRAYFRDEKLKREEALAQKSQTAEDDADFEKISKINDEWNRQVAKVREARLNAERIAMQDEIQWQLEQQREYEAEQRRITDELVLQEKVYLVTFPNDLLHSLFHPKFIHEFSNAFGHFRKRQNHLSFVRISMRPLNWLFRTKAISILPSIPTVIESLAEQAMKLYHWNQSKTHNF